VFNPDPTITSYFAGGVAHEGIDTGLDTPFDFPIYFALRGILLQDKPMSTLEDVLRQDRLYPHPERLVTFLGNHDTTRFMHAAGATDADLKIGFALLATMRGMPQIYSGDEIAMTGGEDPDNRHDFPGGFPGDSVSAFSPRGRTQEQAEVFDWVSALLHFRAEQPALLTGLQQNLFSDESAFVFLRASDLKSGCTANEPARVLVAINHSDHPREITIPAQMTALEGCNNISPQLHAPAVSSVSATGVILQLGAKQAAIYSVWK
jgi:neopullulanase